jgi:hypothetical protein
MLRFDCTFHSPAWSAKRNKTMIDFPFPMAASLEGGEQSPADPEGIEVIYFVGDCPVQIRGRDIGSQQSDVRTVLVVLAFDEAYWANRISDVIDAWETARQSDDPFWVAAVFKQIERLARTSNGLMMFTPTMAGGASPAELA